MLAGRGSDRTRAQPGQDKLLQTTKSYSYKAFSYQNITNKVNWYVWAFKYPIRKQKKHDFELIINACWQGYSVPSCELHLISRTQKIKWIIDPARLLAAWHEESGQNFYRTQNQKWSDNWEAMTPFKEQHILISFTEKTCFDNSDNLWEWNGQHWAWALPGQRTGQSEAWADQSDAGEK